MPIQILLLSVILTALSPAHGDETPRGVMFDNVVRVLRKGYYDQSFRNGIVPQLATKYRQQAVEATSLDAERAVIEEMLGEIPASHLGLLSAAAHAQMMRNLGGERSPTLGFELVRLDDGFFVTGVLEGGPADSAGLKRGDRVLLIDELEPADSPRLDWRSDDAALPDPPMHAILVADDEQVVLLVERVEGETNQVTIQASMYSAIDAAKHSAAVIDVDGHRIACIHFWFVHSKGMDSLLSRLIQGEFKDCEALVLDLRGRGGSADMVMRVLRVLAGRNSKWRKPIVALIDGQTRSAKEMLAHELQVRELGVLVGKRTAGALLPATFVDVGGNTVLMYPAFALGRYSEAIEGKGVAPDVEVDSPLPFCAGADPIREVGVRAAVELAKARALAKQPA